MVSIMFLKTTFPNAHMEGSLSSFQQNMFSMASKTQKWTTEPVTDPGFTIVAPVPNGRTSTYYLVKFSWKRRKLGRELGGRPRFVYVYPPL